ncbi:MAG: GNAT family N-acetyltransferase [Candidatus Hodarchaeales archaeon]|jgi:ribosomal protein S18 acetylase RimI-like enzyme
MKFRNAESEDVESIFTLEVKTFNKNSYPFFFFRQAIELFPNSFIIAEEKNAIIGYCIGAKVSDLSYKGWILSMAVENSFQRQNVGTLLLKKTIMKLKKLKCHQIFLTVKPDNHIAKKLYKKMGFSIVYHDRNYFGKNNSRDIMFIDVID